MKILFATASLILVSLSACTTYSCPTYAKQDTNQEGITLTAKHELPNRNLTR